MYTDHKFHIARELSRRRHAAGIRRDDLEQAAKLPAGTVETAERAGRDIPAADLWRIGEQLAAPMSVFFPPAGPAASPMPPDAVATVARLVEVFIGIANTRQRRAVIGLAEALMKFPATAMSDRKNIEGQADPEAG